MSPSATSTPHARSSTTSSDPTLSSKEAAAQPARRKPSPLAPTPAEPQQSEPSRHHPLRIEHLALAALTPWSKNARTHSRKQVRQIADSITTFGFTNPVLVDGQGTILAGHGRVEAARLLGMERVPCVRLEHMTSAQRRAYVLADDKLALGAGWDEEMLGEELATLMAEAERGFDLAVTGFSVAEVDLLVEGLAVEEPGDPREDALPTAAQAPRRVQPGDVWQLGPHRLVCGDALDPEVVGRLMTRSPEDQKGREGGEGEKGGQRELARMVFTDSPYNVPIDGHVITRKPSGGTKRGAKGKGGSQRGAAEQGRVSGQEHGQERDDEQGHEREQALALGHAAADFAGDPCSPSRPAPRHREFAMASGEMSREQFTAFLTTAFQNMADHACDGSIHFLCMDWRHMREVLDAGEAVSQAVPFELKNLITWVKDNGGMGSFYRSRHELVFAFKKGTAPHVNSFELGQHGRYRTNVWEYRGVNTRRAGRLEELALHPTCKPVQMVADAIKDVSARGEIVLDLFGGSGSTLIAAHKTGRRARLVEIDPVYCDRILARWEQYAHGEAVLVERAGEGRTEVGEGGGATGGAAEDEGARGGAREAERTSGSEATHPEEASR